MSLLAERKRKTKWVVNPTKKPLWTSDSAGIKLGKEIMEKMGWELGKGLGQKEQGMLEPLKISYKNDTKGMGFKGKNEEWIEHQDEFNFLLSQLSGNDSSFGSGKEKVKIKSLEEKSRQSKARVHYQKFTEGKDLSKYSANDLACILGTKMFKKNKKEQDEKQNAREKTFKEGYETSYGVTTIKSGFIHDYFKKKRAIFKPKEPNENILPESYSNVVEKIPNNCDDFPLGKKKNGKRKFESEEEIEIFSKSDEVGVHFNFKSNEDKKKKEKKNQENYCFKLNLDDLKKVDEIKSTDILDFDTANVSKKKKKRKSKQNEGEEKNLVGHVNLHNENNEMRKKQKRKEEMESKNHTTKDEFRESEINVLKDSKSKKKKKNENENSVVEKIESNFMNLLQIKSDNMNSQVKKKKRKEKKEKKEKYIEKQTTESKEENLNEENKTKNKKQKKENQLNGNLWGVNDSLIISSASVLEKNNINFGFTESGNVEKRSKYKEPSNSDLSENDSVKRKKKKCVKNFNQLIEKEETKSLEKINEKNLNYEKKVNPERHSELVEKVVHSHKMELFYKKKKEAVFEKTKILKLRFGFEVEKFKGSNLTTLPGYGVRQS